MPVMRTLLVLALAAQVTVTGFKPDTSVVLPEAGNTIRGQRIQRWCSRAGPALDGYWVPDADHIRAVEKALAPALEKALEQLYAKSKVDVAKRPKVQNYYRQYIGINAGRKPVVYVNGFEELHLSLVKQSRPEMADYWKTQVVFVCDGGSLFFGAEYDVTTGRLGRIEFNSPMASARAGASSTFDFQLLTFDFR